MTITYLGENNFKIKGSGAVVAISDKVVPDSDVLISSNSPNSPTTPQSSSPQPFFIDSPGEYEIKGIHIYGFNTGKDNMAFLINIDGFNIVHLGNVKKLLDDDLASELSEADILLLSLNSKDGASCEVATEIVSQLEPKIVIPTSSELMEPFVKQMGKTNVAEQDKLSLKSPSDLPEETEVTILKH